MCWRITHVIEKIIDDILLMNLYVSFLKRNDYISLAEDLSLKLLPPCKNKIHWRRQELIFQIIIKEVDWRSHA